MIKQLIYIEKQALYHPNTGVILSNLGNPETVVIEHYKDVLNQTPSDWRIQKITQKFILALRTTNFFYRGASITPSFGFDNFYYNTLALNCIYDCDYCYLQGLFTTPHLVLFVNNSDFIKSFNEECLQTTNEKYYLALSYDTDLLAFENIYPYTTEWLNFAATQPNLWLEIRTKSVNIKPLLQTRPIQNAIIAFTVSPQEVITLHEPLTPPLNSRLQAIQKVINHGYKVRLCFDPVLHLPNWKNIYRAMVETIANKIDLDKIDSISVGVFRMNDEFLKRIKQQRNDTAIVHYIYKKENGVSTYSDELKQEMYNFIRDCLNRCNYKSLIEFQK